MPAALPAVAVQLGLSTFTYPWGFGVADSPREPPMTHRELIAEAHRLDAHVVQIADNAPLHALSDDEIARLLENAHESNVSIEVGTRGVGVEMLRRYLHYARLVRAPFLRTVVDTATHQPTPQEVRALLRPLRTQFEDAGVVLAIENHDRFPARVLADLVTDLGTSWVGVCLDTANSLGSLEGPETVVPTLAPLAVNLHVKDVVAIRMPHSLGFTVEGRPAGKGQLDIPAILRAVPAHITAVLELWTPRQATVDDTVTLERRWAEESAAWLGQRIAEIVSPIAPGSAAQQNGSSDPEQDGDGHRHVPPL